MDDELTILFYGMGKERFKTYGEVVPALLEEKHGFKVKGRYDWPKVDCSDVRAVVADEDVRQKSHSWLRHVNSDHLEGLLDDMGFQDYIRGFSVRVTPNNFRKAVSVADSIVDSDMVETYVGIPPRPRFPDKEFDKPPKNTNAPFSYDPAQDFKTEPDFNG